MKINCKKNWNKKENLEKNAKSVKSLLNNSRQFQMNCQLKKYIWIKNKKERNGVRKK